MTRLAPVFVIASLAGAVACAGADEAHPEPQILRLVTGTESGGYYRLGSAFAAAVAREWPAIRPIVELSDGSVANIAHVEAGTGDVGFAQSDAIYRAFEQGTAQSQVPHSHLRAIARLSPNAVQIAARPDRSIRDLSDLAGRRIGIHDPGGGTALQTFRQVLDTQGIPADRVELRSGQRTELLRWMRSGAIDAVAAVSGYPVPALLDVAHAARVHWIALDGRVQHDTRSRYPFFRHVTIPPDTYPWQPEPIETIGIDSVLICRDTLPEQVVFQLTRTFFTSLSVFGDEVPGARLIHAGQAPATPIPLHPGAARYYRERELFQ